MTWTPSGGTPARTEWSDEHRQTGRNRCHGCFDLLDCCSCNPELVAVRRREQFHDGLGDLIDRINRSVGY